MRIVATILSVIIAWASPVKAAEPSRFADELVKPRASQTASGPASVDLASQHFFTGIELYKVGRFEEARVEFEASYNLSKLPDLLHNLSLVAERQGKFSEAIALEERFLAAAAASLTTAERAETQTRMDRLKKELQTPAPRSETSRTDFEVVRRTPAPAIALFSVGLGLLAVSAGTGAGALVTAKTVSDSDELLFEEYQRLVSRGQALERAAISFGVIGGVAVIVGGAWLIHSRVRKAPR